MIKKVLGGKTFLATLKDREFYCQIGYVGNDEYYVYDNGGEGVAVYTLTPNQMIELHLTGSVKAGYLQISDH